MMKYRTANVQKLLSQHKWTGTPETLIKHLIQNLHTSIRTDLSIQQKLPLLSSMLGILPNPIYDSLPEDEAGCTGINKEGNRFLILNTNHPEGRQYFTWAHEITHSLFPEDPKNPPKHQGEYWVIGRNPEVEKLCDYGASEILFFGKNIATLPFNITTLERLVSATHSSIEATAIFMAQSRKWNGGMILWKKSLKKGQSEDQVGLFDNSGHQPKFRVEYALYPDGPFIPKTKSIDIGNVVDHANISGEPQAGEITLNLSHTTSTSLKAQAIPTYKDTVLTLVQVLT